MKILVVDDETLARERLLRRLQTLVPQAHCREASSGQQALEIIAEQAPDVVLLDIRMPGMDGIEVAARLDELEQPPAVIFCTAYDEYALQALRHQAVAYLLKPVREAELKRALGNAGRVNRLQLARLRGSEPDKQAQASGLRTHVSSHTHRGVETLPVDAVRCFLADQKYVTAYGPDAALLLPESLKELEKEFGDRFLRVHRNALVAVQYIVRLRRDEDGSWRAVLDGVSEAPLVSRRHLAAAKATLLER